MPVAAIEGVVTAIAGEHIIAGTGVESIGTVRAVEAVVAGVAGGTAFPEAIVDVMDGGRIEVGAKSGPQVAVFGQVKLGVKTDGASLVNAVARSNASSPLPHWHERQ